MLSLKANLEKYLTDKIMYCTVKINNNKNEIIIKILLL